MRVDLRPIAQADLELLAHHESAGATSPFDDFGFAAAGSVRRRFDEDGFLPEGGAKGRLAITVDERATLAGTASWHAVMYGPTSASRAFNLGIVLLPEHRGKGVGPHALRALAAYLFAHFNVMRLEGTTDVDNRHMQRAAERAGFRREGVLRGAQFRLGEHRDLVMYALLRGELPSG